MLRGCQKKVIHLRSTDSEMFDEAYFIIKETSNSVPCAERDMVREANRILDSTAAAPRLERKKRIVSIIRDIACFTAGMILGAVLLSLIL